jgi:hypothetical protein
VFLLALVLLVMAMAGCLRYPFLFLYCSGEGFFATATHGFFVGLFHPILDAFVGAVFRGADKYDDHVMPPRRLG